MRRVVITGMGIVSCLGNDADSVSQSLREGRSGIRFKEEYKDLGMRSHIAGTPDIALDDFIDRKPRRFMGDAAAYAYIAMQQAITDAGLEDSQVSNERTGLIAGSGGHSSFNQVEAADIARNRGVKRVGPYMVPRVMASTVSACLATPFKIKGINYSIASACATSAHCIGNAMEQIQLGKQDIIFAGGGEEEHWTLSCGSRGRPWPPSPPASSPTTTGTPRVRPTQQKGGRPEARPSCCDWPRKPRRSR